MNEPYECRGCYRTVDPDQEPSPGEPRHCPDCHNLANKLADWGPWDD